jgi:hypothetical protein
MAELNKNLEGLPLKSQLVAHLIKAGPSWVLLFALVAFIGYELHAFLAVAGPATADYVSCSQAIAEQTSKNVELLTVSQAINAKEHKAILAALIVLQNAIESQQLGQTSRNETIVEMLKAISSLTTSVDNIPAMRKEMISMLNEMKLISDAQSVLLEEIRHGIAELHKAILEDSLSRGDDESN